MRGPPGVLFTCQQGLEQRCRQDAMDLLHHDWKVWMDEQTKNSSIVTTSSAAVVDDGESDAATTTTGKQLSLDDELQQLKSSKNTPSKNNIFHLFETKCKGVVILVCTACPLMIDPYQHGLTADTTTTTTTSQSKRPRLAEPTPTANDRAPVVPTSPPAVTTWDPLQAIDRIMADVAADSSSYPSSRCIARLLPFQASCYPSIAELQHTLRSLLQRQQDLPATATFAIRIQRRLCNDAALKRPALIDAMASILLDERPQWTVDLGDPTMVVQLELCQTIACVALCPAAVAAVRITDPPPPTPATKRNSTQQQNNNQE